MTTATSAMRAENIRQIREMMVTVKPDDLTDDDAAAMAAILKAAWDRKQEPIQAGVVYLDSVRSRPRPRRLGRIAPLGPVRSACGGRGRSMRVPELRHMLCSAA